MRRTLVAAAVAAIATIAAIMLYLDNRRLEREAARLRAAAAPSAAPATAQVDPWAKGPAREQVDIPRKLGGEPGGASDRADGPDLPEEPKESRMERRARRQAELAVWLGREPGESEEDYRARILPLLEMALSQPRDDVANMRKEAEAAAGVTPEQSAKLDTAFAEVYDELITYTDGAVQDGVLTPYERNVAGMLDYAGGLGGILNVAEQKIGGILTPDQVQAMSASGFEWAEYLGVSAPWERLRAPPPPPGGS